MSITKEEYNKIYMNAAASSKMEGLTPSDSAKKLGFEFLNGRISKEEYIKILLERSRA